jgi:hypothetical protein
LVYQLNRVITFLIVLKKLSEEIWVNRY